MVSNHVLTCPYTHSCGSHPLLQKIFFFLEIESIKKATMGKCREQLTVGCPSPGDTSTEQPLHLRLSITEEGRKTMSGVRCLLCKPGRWHPGYQQCGFLNNIQNRITSTDMPVWMGAFPQGLTPRRRATDNRWLLGEGGPVFPRGELSNRLANLQCKALNKYTYEQHQVISASRVRFNSYN